MLEHRRPSSEEDARGIEGVELPPLPARPAAEPGVGARVREWFLRSRALSEADRRGLSPRQRAALRAARQATELAERAVDLPEAYREGPPLGAALRLYQDAVWWSLQVVADESAEEPSLAQLTATNLEVLRAASASEQELAHLRGALLEAGREELERRDEQSQLLLAGDALRLVRALIAQVGEPDARIERLRRQRWLRPGLALALLACAALCVVLVRMPRNLAAKKTWIASSAGWTFARAGNTGQRGSEGLMFHTDLQDNPWVTVDLGSLQSVRGIKLENRVVCCQERAVPLAVEVSVDGKSWTEVARRSELFTAWDARFRKVSARYVRLRVLRHSVLHLQNVEVLD